MKARNPTLSRPQHIRIANDRRIRRALLDRGYEVVCLDNLLTRHPGETIAIVSHGDPLRAVVAHYLGISLDLLLRFEIAPASVSTVRLAEWGAQVLCLNNTGEIPI